MHRIGDDREQTPAQWAVRWHALVLLVAVLAASPVAYFVWHVAMGRSEPMFRTRAFAPPPPLAARTLLDGSWSKALEVHLREASPLAFWIRGTWNEAMYRVGMPQSRDVHFGSDGWLYSAHALRHDVRAVAARREARLARLEAVKRAVEAAGARLFVLVVPDKERVHPEHATADGRIPAGKEPIYRDLLADLRTAGIATVDLEAAFAAARAASPDRLYQRCDSHWEALGALCAARAVAAAVAEQGLESALSPRLPVAIASELEAQVAGDYWGNCGFLLVDEPGPPPRSRPMSSLTYGLLEPSRHYAAGVLSPGGVTPFDPDDAGAEILLAGTSFSKSNGASALRLALARPVRAVLRDGAASIESARDTLALLPSMPRVRLVLWEVVERGFLEDGWDRFPDR